MADPQAARPKVAIVGGGMGSLATAWHLSRPGWRDRFDSIVVYQRGWRLGGKGATGRGPNDRIEEHGLHVLLGYYHNAFALLDEVYTELDRDTTDPGCPIRSLEEMVQASPRVGVTDLHDGQWSTWVAEFSTDGTSPVRPGGTDRRTGMNVVELARRALQLLVDFAVSTIGDRPDTDEGPLVVLDLTPGDPPGDRLLGWLRRVDTVGQRSVLSVLAAALEAVRAVQYEGRRRFERTDPFVDFAAAALDVTYDRLRRLTAPDPAARRFFQLADIVVTILRGLARDGVLTSPGRLRALNDLDFRDWLTHHGADPLTVESPLIRGVYDLAFAYREGDPAAPAFPAGLGIYLSGRMFFDYHGSIFWKMRCGMGDGVFAPMYEALRNRGVRFEFFHSLQNVELGQDRRVDGLRFLRQVDLADGVDSYEPLVRVRGLPAWPARPLEEQLARPLGPECELLWGDPPESTTVTLRAGVDFDVAVLGVSRGILPYVCDELIQASPRWRAMVDHLPTVPTQAVQLWLRPSEAELGWNEPDVTISGYVEPFDTWASMNHVLRFESWPADDGPRTVAYFCNVLQTAAAPSSAGQAEAVEQVRLNAVHFLDNHVGLFWPKAARLFPDRFDWTLLHASDGKVDVERLDDQYVRANLDPSDQYVQALPATAAYRMRTDETGFDNLYLAGDWIDTGLNAGCLEAAVMSGMQAAAAVLGPGHGIDIAALTELREYFG